MSRPFLPGSCKLTSLYIIVNAMLISACSPFQPFHCEHSPLATIEEGAAFEVPDQDITGCASVHVKRIFSNDFERALIIAAEHAPPTTGGGWWEPYYSGHPFKVAVAITADAIRYYAERSQGFAVPPDIEGQDIDPTFDFEYSAEVVQINEDATEAASSRFEVKMIAQAWEMSGGTTMNPLGWLGLMPTSGVGCDAERIVTFDADGNMLSIVGDGQSSQVVIN